MKRFLKVIVMMGFFCLFLLFLTSLSQSYYGGFLSYPLYSAEGRDIGILKIKTESLPLNSRSRDVQFKVLIENASNPVKRFGFKVIFNKDILEYDSESSQSNLDTYHTRVYNGTDSEAYEYTNHCQLGKDEFSDDPNSIFSLNVGKSSIASLYVSDAIPKTDIKQGDSCELMILPFNVKTVEGRFEDTILVLTNPTDDLEEWYTEDGFLKIDRWRGYSGPLYVSYPGGYIIPTLGYAPFTLSYPNPYLPNPTYNNYGACQGFYPSWQPATYWQTSLFQQPFSWQPNLYQQSSSIQSLWPY